MNGKHQIYRRAAIAIVLLHALVSGVHGAAHNALSISMTPWQNAYIGIVITLLPLVSAVLIWRDRRTGFVLLLVSMLGSLLFGVYYHFILVGPDHVAYLGQHSWAIPFQVSAAVLAGTEIVGAAVGLGGLRTSEH